MSWICRGCHREAVHIRAIIEGDEIIEQCERPDCGNLSMVDTGIPDVFLKRGGQQFENLCDPTGKPYEITSKRQKKEVMDRLGVREAGDQINGAPFGTKSWIDGTREHRRAQFAKDRPALRRIFKEWKEKANASH
jgi:hypothetical protein